MPEYNYEKPKLRQYIKLPFVIAGMIYLFSLLLEKIDIPVNNLSLVYLLLFLVFSHIFNVIYAFRLIQSMSTERLTINVADAIKIHLQSQFYFFCIPVVGMDACRFFKIRALIGSVTSNSSIITALFYDRIAGIIGPILVSFSLIFFFKINDTELKNSASIIFLFLVFSIFFTFLFLYFVRNSEVVKSGLDKRTILRLARVSSIEGYAASFTMGLAVYFGGLAIGYDLQFELVVLGAAISIIANIIPINFLGAGPSDVLMGAVYLMLGFSIDVSILLVSLGYISRLIGAVEGAFLEIFNDTSILFKKNSKIYRID